MQQIEISADDLVATLLKIATTETVCVLDSCGVSHLGSHLLIAGIEPVSLSEISEMDSRKTLAFLDQAFVSADKASIFTISYDFGRKLLNISPEKHNDFEPDVFLAEFDSLIIHDYNTGETKIAGNAEKGDTIKSRLLSNIPDLKSEISNFESDITVECENVRSNFTRAEYLSAIEAIKELIRDGDTYQTNLTQQLTAKLPDSLTPEVIFARLCRDHPAPFAAFIKRLDSTVVSISPERFFRIGRPRVSELLVGSPHVSMGSTRYIETSPIKGTRPRGNTSIEDTALRNELLASEKDRAENTMIVDLLRNDLGRICEYYSIRVEKLCELEEHPTLFHLVSTISGDLRNDAAFSDILKAVFPCGSITGVPKVSTMKIIDEIETKSRGLSMGAIGYHIPNSRFQIPNSFDLSVAIRTMVIKDQIAAFNVGGGIVIDSDPESEYKETLTKAKALIDALGGNLEHVEQMGDIGV